MINENLVNEFISVLVSYVEAHPQCLSRFPAVHAICMSTSLISPSFGSQGFFT